MLRKKRLGHALLLFIIFFVQFSAHAQVTKEIIKLHDKNFKKFLQKIKSDCGLGQFGEKIEWIPIIGSIVQNTATRKAGYPVELAETHFLDRFFDPSNEGLRNNFLLQHADEIAQYINEVYQELATRGENKATLVDILHEKTIKKLSDLTNTHIPSTITRVAMAQKVNEKDQNIYKIPDEAYFKIAVLNLWAVYAFENNIK